MPPVMSRRDSRARAERAYYMRHTMRLPWSAIRDGLGFKSVGAAQLAVKGQEQRTPPETAAGIRRSANETLNELLSNEREMYDVARLRGDDDAAVMHADKILKLVAEQTKMHGAYLPQPVADQNVSVHVETGPSMLGAEWLRQVAAAQPAALPSMPVLDVEVIPS